MTDKRQWPARVGATVLALMGWAAPLRAEIPPGMTCTSDPLIVACFQAFKTDLRDFQDDQIDAIAEHIADEFEDLGQPHQTYMFTGHASTFGDTPPETYLINSFGRATNVVKAVRQRLEAGHGLGPAKITLVPVGQSDANPRPGVGLATQQERALHRRVEFELIPRPGPLPAQQCTVLKKDDLRDIAFVLLGREPEQLPAALLFSEFVQEGLDNQLCDALGNAPVVGKELQVACFFTDRYHAMLSAELNADPEKQLGGAMGAAYAITDGLEHRNRAEQSLTRIPQRFRATFRIGYTDMQTHMLVRASDPRTRAVFKNMMAGLACGKNGRVQVNAIYDAIMEVLIAEARTQAERLFWETAGNCTLTYPRLSTPSCGPF